MFKAKSVMTTEVITVDSDTPVYEAMETLVERNVTGLPVVDWEKNLLGIVSEKDMLRLLYEEDVRDAEVETFMTKDVVTFGEDDDLIDVCEALIENNFRRVPIVKDGKLVGIISRRDIMKFILKLRQAKK